MENKTGVVSALTRLILVSGGKHEVISEWQKLRDTSLTRRPFWNSVKFKYSRQQAQHAESSRDKPIWGTESLEWPKENGEWSPGSDKVKILPYIQDFISVHPFKLASAVPWWEMLWGVNEIMRYDCFCSSYHHENGSLLFFPKASLHCDLSSYLLGDLHKVIPTPSFKPAFPHTSLFPIEVWACPRLGGRVKAGGAILFWAHYFSPLHSWA